jgi:hypothetical protein
MPKIPDEKTIRLLTEKYVKSLERNTENIPDIRQVITDALKDAAPERDVNPDDVTAVIHELATRPTINDKIIAEAAKSVADHSAHQDLIFSIKTYAKQLKTGKAKFSDKDVEEIVKRSKLDPFTSTPFQIKNAVRDYYTGARPVEAMSQDELRDVVRTELAKHGPIDGRDVTDVLTKFLKVADKEKPVQPAELQDVVKKHVATKPLTLKPSPSPVQEPSGLGGPKTTPVDRPETPSENEPEETEKQKVEPGPYIKPLDTKNMTFFEKIRAKMHRYGIPALSKFSRNWLKDNVNKAKVSPTRKKLLTQGDTVADAVFGKMFFYFYDAKTKDDLPYWDKFPLIFVIDMYKDGWLGLNLHYLPIPLRIKLFDKLLEYADNKQLDHIEKLRVTYQTLKGFSTIPEARPCIKRYLSEYVKSDLLKVEAIDWDVACFIPCEQFQKQSKEKVWSDSKKKINRGKK